MKGIQKTRLLVVVLMLVWSHVSSAQPPDSPFVQLPDQTELYDTVAPVIARYDPWKAVGLSAALPGAGQAYTTAWLRGGAFFTAELIAVLSLINRVDNWDNGKRQVELFDDLVRELRDSLQTVSDSGSRERLNNFLQQTEDDRLVARYQRREARYSMYHAIGWATGIYVWNLMDALSASNYFKTTEPKSPAVAGWLSAIPGLGLGQLYNQALSKAGMVWTVQTMLGVMAYDYHRLMQTAADRRRLYVPDGPDQAQRWRRRYNDAFTQRNMYLWYSVFFYFYGIFDAVVDAHLHDYPRQIRFEPVVKAAGQTLGFQTVVRF